MDEPVAANAASSPLRIVHCEDAPNDAELVERALRRWRPDLHYRRVFNESGFRSALVHEQPDLVLCDYTVPGFGGPAALAIALDARPATPFIFVSGTIGEDNAIDSLRQGATDYVLKNRLNRLVPAVSRALLEADLRRREADSARKLAHHRRLLAAVLAALPDFVYAVDRDNRIIACNSRTAELFRGRSSSGIANALLTDLRPAGIDMAEVANENATIMADGRDALELNRRLVDADGSERYLAVSKTLIRDLETNALEGLVAVARDVTDRLRLERAVLETSEREQRRIGSDLHDGLGQELAGLGLLLGAAERSLTDDKPHALASLLRAQEVLHGAKATARRLARGLAPVDLEDAGLPAALTTLAERSAAMFSIECLFVETDTAHLDLDASVAGHLYRIAQEAIGNGVRHGGATRVVVRLVGAPDLLLEITDDGHGFDAERSHASPGMGLRLMQYRASIIGCRLEVISSRAGTQVSCHFLPHPHAAAGEDRY